MNRQNAEQVILVLEKRGELDRLTMTDASAALACSNRARARLDAARVLVTAQHWESAYTTAYDAYRTAADAVVLCLGYRVPAVKGAHRISADVAHAALRDATSVFAPPAAEKFRDGRHQSEYFDPERQVDKTEADVVWAVTQADEAVETVGKALSAL